MKQTILQPLKQEGLTTSIQQPAMTFFAAGMIGLGVLALTFGDFALVWQPVAAWVPGRTALAYVSGVLMLATGIGLLFRATVAWSVRILFPYLILWSLLKIPALFVAPQIEGVWLGFGELAVLLSGGWVLFARLSELKAGSKLASISGDKGVRIAKYFFAIWVIPIGLSHFIYLKETANFVPAWLPFRTGWACLTGAGHIACGLAVLFSVIPRVAAMLEAAMIGAFTLLVWGPAIIAKPRDRFAWTAFFISWAIGSAAWVVASNIATKRSVLMDE
ncbi:DoxX family protein [Alloacidobacterium sp.]|uniref:DoxX family protein n=1 Tax=Alloacidobacterium sp. TaxID=2951999 RepID=UPI002D2787E0|nr:DoxX family protein [Alloacidobacterium sp.]HYK37380.1 DoxX family protein [Alloacidobacterium sp.]